MALKTAKEWKLEYDWPQELLTEDLQLFFSCFDVQIQEYIDSVNAFPNLTNPELIPEELLDLYLLSRGFRLAIDFPGIELSINEKRKLAILAVPLYRQKGTAVGMKNIVRLLLGIEIDIVSQYNVNVWKIGVSELGVDTVLSTDMSLPINQHFLYTFDVVFLQAVTVQEEQKTLALIEFMKPIHTHIGETIPPETPPDHWELGVSELEVTSDLH